MSDNQGSNVVEGTDASSTVTSESTPIASIEATQGTTYTTYNLWNLDRIDQNFLPLDNKYTYTYTGSGVDVYIVDTGIRTAHTEFGGRARCGYSVWNDGCVDGDGHGTHVAGTVVRIVLALSCLSKELSCAYHLYLSE